MLFFIIILQGGFLYELPFVIEGGKELRGRFVMDLVGGPGIDIERYTELLERVLDHGMVLVNYFLWGDPLLPGLDGDGYAMLIGAADIYHLFPFGAEVADVDVGRDVYTGEVTDMDRAVGIWQGGGYRSSFPGF
jgi:hypothetical protein